MNDKEELTELILNSVRVARKIADDDGLYGKVKCQDIDFDKHDIVGLSVFENGEKARGFLFELQNFYKFPENQELYFRGIKRDYFNKRTEILIEVKKHCDEEAEEVIDSMAKYSMFTAGSISAVLGVGALAGAPFLGIPASLFGIGLVILYDLNKKGKENINNFRKERDKLFGEWREETESISLDQFKEVMYKNRAEIKKYL